MAQGHFNQVRPGNYPKESIQHTEHGESLKSRSQIKTALSRIRNL